MGFALESLASEIRYAWRRLMHAPVFTAVAVLTLALGVGVNTAFFSLINGVMFRPLDVPYADRLVSIERTSNGEVYLGGGLNHERLERLRARQPQRVRDLFAVGHHVAAVEREGVTSLVSTEPVSGNYFSALGLKPLVGRLLVAEDDLAGANGPVVLSARMWRRDFAGDPSVVGRVIGVSGVRLTVVGVAPESFRGMSIPNLLGADLWMPMNSMASLLESPGSAAQSGPPFGVFARLAEGVSLKQADAELRVLGAGIDPRDPDVGLAVVPASKNLVPPPLVNIEAALAAALLAVSGLVLFIACANLSGLMLARSSRRTNEIAVRIAIGAERHHVMRMQMAETSLLAALAAIVGFAAAWGVTRVVPHLPIPEIGGFVMHLDATPDPKVFLFALIAATATVMLVGWAPASRAADTDPLRAWASSGGAGGTTPRMQTSTTKLVVFQVGASLTLLLVATLFVRGANAASSYDTSLDLTQFAAGRVNLRARQIKDADGPAVFDRLLATPPPVGIRGVALASGVPIAGNGRLELAYVDGQLTRFISHGLVVSPEFFPLLDLSFSAGRAFTEQDAAGQPSVVIVNEALAADLWPGESPMGRTFKILSMQGGPLVTVVGVVKEVDHTPTSRQEQRYFFVPLKQHYTADIHILVAGSSDPRALTAGIKSMAAEAMPGVAVFDAQPVSAMIGLKATGARFAGTAIGSVGVLGFLIAMVGLYGTVAYLVAERTREFGIMRALGADASHIRKLVIHDAIRMLALGMAPGLILTFLLAGFLKAYLLGLPPHDPLTFLVVPAAMFLVGLVAALIPARRATRVDPTVAIREL